jgi:ABC-type polysaccharide/polyol phosphate export permease
MSATPISEPEYVKAEARRRRLLRRNRSTLGDLWAGLQLHNLWTALAFEDLVQKYRRAALGVSWIAISFILMIAIFVAIFGRSSPVRTEFEYALYLSTGLVAFTFISTMVTRGASLFGANGSWVRSSRAPLSVLVYSNILSSFLEMAIVAVVVLPLVAIHGVPTPEQLLIIMAALVLYAINAVWCSLLFGSLGAWSSDFQQLVPAIMRIAFFATPVFWDYEVVEGRRLLLAHYNPFTHFVELLRQPLMMNYPSLTNWIVVGGVTIGGWVLAIVAFSFAKRRLAAWV